MENGSQTSTTRTEDHESTELFAWWAVLRGSALAEAARAVLAAEELEDLGSLTTDAG